MKQVVRRVIDRKGSIQIEELPAPRPGELEVLVDVRYSAISTGTEMSTLGKTLPQLAKQTLSDPWMRQAVKNVLASGGVLGTADRVHDELIAYRVVGYSGSGIVLETGSGVTGMAVGDEVAFCGHGHADLVCPSRNQCVRLPEGLALRSAAFGTIGAIALQGVRRAGVEIGEWVAVIGLGLVGQLGFQLAQAAGGRCIGIEPRKERRELARELGIRETVDPTMEDAVARVLALTGGHGADRVLICASGKDRSIANSALKMARLQGRVTVLGIVPMELERMPFFRRELDFVFSRAYGPGPFDADWERGRIEYPLQYVRWDARRNLQAFLELVGVGRVRVEPLISGIWPVTEAQAAYDAVSAGGKMAAILEYQPSAEPESRRIEVAPARNRVAGDTVRIGLIGCGNFSRSVLLPELSRVSGARLKAIAAASGINAKPMAEKYKAEYITTDYREMLEDKELEAVIVATRHHLHAAMARAALEAGKHVMVEKPMAMTATEAVELVELAKSKGLHLIVGHNRRYAPLTRELLKRRPPGPAMGQYTVSIRPLPADHWTLNATEGGGRLLGESDHFFDILNLFARSRPVSVSAIALTMGEQEPGQSCNFSVQIRYENGSAATLLYTDLGSAGFPRERLELFAGGSVLRLEDYGKVEVLGKRGFSKKSKVQMGHRQELENFVQVILGKAEPLGTAEDGLLATLVAQAARQALRNGSSMPLSFL